MAALSNRLLRPWLQLPLILSQPSTRCISDEVNAATAAASNRNPSSTVFSRILNKELPADIVYEDDKVAISVTSLFLW